jgi:hypothetical protein
MLMQTNAYTVPPDKRDAHERLMRRFADAMRRNGATFEVYEQVTPDSFTNPALPSSSSGRFVQVVRVRDARHLQQVQERERSDPASQQLIREFIDLIDLPSQQEQGTYLPGFYASLTTSDPPPSRFPNQTP